MGISVDISDWAAVFIALAALGVSIHQGYVTREHNKKSVRPHLSFGCIIDRGHPIRINLANNGLGPAFITRFDVIRDGSKLSFPSIQQIDGLFRSAGASGTLSFFSSRENSVMSPGQVEILFEQLEENEISRNADAFKNIRWEIRYKSIYDEEFKITVNPRLTKIG